MKIIRTVAVVCMLLGAVAAGAQESGGVTGADFLISPPLARVDAMGGVIDVLGASLDGMFTNPAALAWQDGTRVQLTVVPLPNEVLNTQLAVGFPLFGGYGGASAQLLNTGGITFFSASGQPQGSANIFDVAAGISYARTFWSFLDAGASVRAVYRVLGDYSAAAVSGDVGTATRFETPHIGQAPKPPTRRQFQEELSRELARIDAEKVRRDGEATRKSAELSRAIADAEKGLADLSAQIGKTEEAKRAPLEARRAESQAKLDELRGRLDQARTEEQQALADTATWQEAEHVRAQAVHDGKVRDLEWVESERARLFEVISDPATDLEEPMISSNIDESIAKTQDLLSTRTQALQARLSAFQQKGNEAVASTEKAISGYQDQIDAESGPRIRQLTGERDQLKARKAELEAQPKSDAAAAELKDVTARLAAVEKDLAAAAADPWVRRLQDRIQQKKQEIARITAASTALAAETEKAVAQAQATAAKDTKSFEDLRAALQKDLKKAKLKRDLAGLEAANKAASQKARTEYKATEKQIYLRLLAAMYNHEEKLFQTRLSALRTDADTRKADFAAQVKEREALEDEVAFQQRQLAARLDQATRNLPKGTTESADTTALRGQLRDLAASEKEARDRMDKEARDFTAAEKISFDAQNAAILSERDRVRLVYLQTDTPYRNTAVSLGVRNVGTPIEFVATAAPLPTTASLGLSYAVLNIENQKLLLAAQLDWPFYESWSVGVGLEYTLFGLASARLGYNFNSLASGLSAMSAGFGVRFAAGFTEYAVDYAFKPLADYGFQHSIGVSISF